MFDAVPMDDGLVIYAWTLIIGILLIMALSE